MYKFRSPSPFTVLLSGSVSRILYPGSPVHLPILLFSVPFSHNCHYNPSRRTSPETFLRYGLSSHKKCPILRKRFSLDQYKFYVKSGVNPISKNLCFFEYAKNKEWT